MNDAEPSLVEKVIALHDTLAAASIDHAFGGALALAYYTLEPRATADVDINIAVDPLDAERVLRQLPPAVPWSDSDLRDIERDEQIRLWWGRTPVDLFFRASDFHDDVATRVQRHPFAGVDLPFLAAGDLAVFKALFDRPKDWLDIAAMHAAGAIDVSDVAVVVRSLVGDDSRVARLTEVGRSE